MLESGLDTELLATFADTFAKRGSPTRDCQRPPHGAHDPFAETVRWCQRDRCWGLLPPFSVQNSCQAVLPASRRRHSPFLKSIQDGSRLRVRCTIIQSLIELDPSTTVICVDGVGAFDSVSRSTMLSGLLDMEEGERLLLFVRMFHSQPSFHLFDDEVGEHHPSRRRW